MPLFNSQFSWRGIGTTVVVELVILLALAFAVVGYVEWSSNAAVTKFMSATESSASDPNHSNESSTPIQSLKGQTGCPLGKRSPPTQLMPLP
jgi:hypothetical protein